MTSLTVPRAVTAGAALILSVGLLAGCAAHAPGELGRLQQILETCPKDQPINAYVTTDGTGTSQDQAITTERLKSIRAVVDRVAVCGGHLTVTAFGTNSVTTPILDADITIDGATPNARLRRVPKVTEEVMAQVTKHYEPAIEALPQQGTDVTGLYRLFGEAKAERPGQRLEVLVLTDGLTNQGVNIDHSLSTAEATALADTVPVPDLSGSSLSVVGIGRVAGNPVPSTFIDGLKAFYTRLCEKTGADQCLVATDGK